MDNFDTNLMLFEKKIKCRFSHKIAEFCVESGQKSGKGPGDLTGREYLGGFIF